MDDVDKSAVAQIEITLNGRARSVQVAASVSDLIAAFELQDRLVVVERNGEIVARGQFASALLTNGDTLEIVHFVGGG